MSIWFIKQEHGLPLLRQAALSLAQTMQTDILGLVDPKQSPSAAAWVAGDLTITELCAAIRSADGVLVTDTVASGDTIIFEMPSYYTDQLIWTGIVQYQRAIQNALNGLNSVTTSVVHVVAISCLPWSL